MTLRSTIAQKQRRMESVPAALFTSVDRAQHRSLSRIVDLLDTLDRSGGQILTTSRNLRIIDQLGDAMSDELVNSGYLEGVRDFVREIPKEAELSKEMMRQSFGDFSDKELYGAVTQRAQRRAVEQLGDDAINAVFTSQLKQQLESSVANNAGFGDTVQLLRNTIEGDDEREGVLNRHVKRVTRDTYNVADRELQQTIANDLNAVYARYMGGSVDDTRDFCSERNGRYFHREEIAAWGEGQATQDLQYPISGDWPGKNRDATNANTIYTILGGYNCMHFLIWVDTKTVPSDVRQYARNQGYSNP